MKHVLHPLALAASLLGFLVLLRDLRANRRDPALAALAAVFLLTAASFALSLIPMHRSQPGYFGASDLSGPPAQGCVIALLVCQQIVLGYWGGPVPAARRHARAWIAAGTAVLAGLSLLYLFLTPAGGQSADFFQYYARDAFYDAYLALYVTPYVTGELLLARACWRLARRTTQPWVGRGLRLVAVGAVVTLGYSAIRLGDIIAPPFGTTLDRWEGAAWTCGDVGAMLTLLGWFLPAIAHGTSRTVTRARMHLQYRRLRPLWLAFYQADPAIALQPARTTLTAHLRVRKIYFHLYRRAVEIRDGQINTRPYLDAATRARAERHHVAAGRTGRDLHAAVTADQIHAALHAQAHNTVPQHRAEYADTHIATHAPVDDLNVLLAIARHFAAHTDHKTSHPAR
ncbi:MAB_1171c family putative transporter [Streptomyces sp. NPDC057654]|uniref:MAB_1171c family putative transporter n=1 Tax=Streptomyces sp. NPDC057654 TaxID=3346196 RepID=UPI0036B7BE8A